jgi:hypothetical protein
MLGTIKLNLANDRSCRLLQRTIGFRFGSLAAHWLPVSRVRYAPNIGRTVAVRVVLRQRGDS